MSNIITARTLCIIWLMLKTFGMNLGLVTGLLVLSVVMFIIGSIMAKTGLGKPYLLILLTVVLLRSAWARL